MTNLLRRKVQVVEAPSAPRERAERAAAVGAAVVPTTGPAGAAPANLLEGPFLALDDRADDYISQESHLVAARNMRTTTDATVKGAGYSNDALDRRIAALRAMMMRTGCSPGTADTYGRYIALAAAAAGSDPAEWDGDGVAALIASPAWAAWTEGTRNVVRHALRKYWLVSGVEVPRNLEFELARRTPYGGGRNRRAELKAKAPSPDEVAKVIAYCRGVVATSSNDDLVYDAFATFFVAAYGLRCVDAASVRVCDVDLVKGVLHVPKGKGGKARDVFMDVPMDGMFERFMSVRARILGRTFLANSSVLKGPDGHLFFSRVRGEAGGSAVRGLQHLIPRTVALAIGRRINAHAFRHAKAFELLEVRKVPIQTAAQYLGHSSIQTTMEYSYADVEAQRNAFGAAPAAPAAAAPDVRAKVAALSEMLKAGVLTTEQFAAAVGAL